MLGFDWMWNSGFIVLHVYLMTPVVARCFSRSDCELLLQLEQINLFYFFWGQTTVPIVMVRTSIIEVFWYLYSPLCEHVKAVVVLVIMDYLECISPAYSLSLDNDNKNILSFITISVTPM